MKNSERPLFDLAEDEAYFNVAGMSPLLKTVRAAGIQGLALKSQPWKIHGQTFFEEPARARALFAQLIGAHSDDIALIPSASYGVATALKNISLPAGSEVLIQAEEFPSMFYGIERHAREAGARLVTIPRPVDGDWTQATLNLINSRTALVGAVPAHWTDGTRLDCEAIGARCREVGAKLVIDGCQSIGAQVFDVRAVRPDFLIVPTYKWMMGPYGYGFLYVAPAHQQGTPLEETWLGRSGSENFADLVNYRSEYRPGAARFDMGERSNSTLLPMAIAALEQILAWGVPRISERIGDVVEEIAAAALKKGYVVAPKANRSAHLIGLRHPRGVPSDLATRLEAERIYLSLRGDSIRIAPHLHVSQRDVDRLISQL